MRDVRICSMLLLAWVLFSSWGFLVHRTVNQIAVYQLPKDLRTFFHINMDYIVRHSVRPDLRRSEDSTEDKKHFINFEKFGDSAAWKMPYNWDEAVRLYSKDSLLEYGYVPYHVIVMKSRLTNAFRSMKKDSILFYAADLAHYISDAHVPLHTTTNYDGQLTNQKGLHSLWESIVPEIQLDQFDLGSRHRVKYLKHPELSIWQAVRNAHTLLPEVFAKELEVSRSFPDSIKFKIQIRRGKETKSYSGDFARAYGKLLGASINRQLLKSADLTADFWYTCWVDAGRPDIMKLNAGPPSEAQKQALQKECKAFRENMLLKQKLLLSRQENNKL